MGKNTLHSFNQLIQIILIIVFGFGQKSKIDFCNFVDVINVIRTKASRPQTSAGMIKLLFIIPTVNRNVV